jgi:hypothetical protein
MAKACPRKIRAEVGTRVIEISQATADEWYRAGLARWVGRNRLQITARFNPNGDLRGISAVVGEAVSECRDDWSVVFRREQFLKREMRLQER